MDGKELVEQKTPEPSIPGIGISGTIMCPQGFQKSPCLKGGCEYWVELQYGEKNSVGRCAVAWKAILSVELRESIDKLTLLLQAQNEKNKTEE